MGVELKYLTGQKMLLTGVETLSKSEKLFGKDEPFDDASVINFVLDGVTYCAIENPDDGYRSSLRSLEIVDDVEITNEFPPCIVIGRMADPGGNDDDILELVDVATNKVVLQVGTSNTNDYYPCFVANFMPQNMVANGSEEERQKAIDADRARKAKLEAELAAIQAEQKALQAERDAYGWGTF